MGGKSDIGDKVIYPCTDGFQIWKEDSDCEHAVDVAKRVLCLPLFPSLREEDLEEIVRVVKDTESSAP